MSHVILLGDSIFDNAVYVPDRPPVIEQVRRGLPTGWKATLLAIDGHTVEDMATQLPGIPTDATHLVISVGGNNALIASALLSEPAVTLGDALAMLAEVTGNFQKKYLKTIGTVVERGLPVVICTIYDSVPNLDEASRAALSGFNDVIILTAIALRIPVIDLRAVCNHPNDYSPLSPIEPSVVGGAKIADVICRVVAGHDFGSGRTTIWV